MPIGRTREEQELNERLAKGLVQREVMQPMEQIGWGHGTPPPPKQDSPGSGQPAAEGAPGDAHPGLATNVASGLPAPPVKSPSEPKADAPNAALLDQLFEPLRDANGLIQGKYKTGIEAFKGAGHLANMAKQAFNERDTLLAKVRELEARPAATTTAAAPAASPKAPLAVSPSRERLDKAQAALDTVLSGIAEDGGVLDGESVKKLSQANREVADASAEYRVAEDRALRDQERERASADEQEWRKVDEYMSTKYPASARFSDEAALYVKSDPLLASAVNALMAQGRKLEATELAWQTYERVHGAEIATSDHAKAQDKEEDLKAREQVREEKVREARRDAGVIVGSSGGAGIHERNASGSSRDEVAAATEAMRREGDAPGSPAAMRFRQLVIGPSLDPSIFGPR